MLMPAKFRAETGAMVTASAANNLFAGFRPHPRASKIANIYQIF
jgi:hypothetical protein